MSRLAYVLMMMWIAGLALGLPAGMVTHGSKAGAKDVRVIDANDDSVDTQIAKNGTVAAKVSCGFVNGGPCNPPYCCYSGPYCYCCYYGNAYNGVC